MEIKSRPKANIHEFQRSIELAGLLEIEYNLVEHIRYIGTFTQPYLIQALRIPSKPPVLSILCNACRKIGAQMPEHFSQVRQWSQEVSVDGVRWDGDLICSVTFNIDGDRLTPESGTTQFHNFAVHRELFIGFE